MKIIVHLSGGLGNQLFQYALGRRINEENSESSLYLNFEDHYKLAKRQYSLGILKIKAAMASPDDLVRIGPERKLRRRLKLIFGVPIEKTVVREKKEFRFDPEIIEIKSDSYFIGFWQSYKYFESIRKILLDEFWPATPRTVFTNLCNVIKSDPKSTAIHIRRSDYLNKGKFFTTLDIQYYHNAIGFINQQLGSTNFYVFTDDPQWAESVFVPSIDCRGAMKIISDSALFDYEELCLMSLCSNAIVANSSFSWWASWLNQSDQKVIVAPKYWNGRNSDVSLTDLIPGEWVMM